MESVRKLEVRLIDFYKQWPHLPKEAIQFIVNWAWLFTLIGVVLGALGIVSILFAVFLGSALLIGFAGPVGAAVGGAITIAVITTLLFSIVILYLEAMAITPLKNKQKKGWDYIYYAVLVSIVSAVVGVIFSLNIGGLISTAVGAAIGGYILFETRSSFLSHATQKSRNKEKAAKPAILANKK